MASSTDITEETTDCNKEDSIKDLALHEKEAVKVTLYKGALLDKPTKDLLKKAGCTWNLALSCYVGPKQNLAL